MCATTNARGESEIATSTVSVHSALRVWTGSGTDTAVTLMDLLAASSQSSRAVFRASENPEPENSMLMITWRTTDHELYQGLGDVGFRIYVAARIAYG